MAEEIKHDKERKVLSGGFLAWLWLPFLIVSAETGFLYTFTSHRTPLVKVEFLPQTA
jgi:hypothetical protein